MTTFTEQIEQIINSEETSLKKAELGIRLCNKTLTKLQERVAKEDFEDAAEEIAFFKNIKPIPMSYLIYFTEIRTCELNIPKAGIDPKIHYLEKEVKKINEFFTQNNDFVNYMEQSYNYLDHVYFTRHNLENFPFAPTINYYQYPEFSTSHDMLWAKIQAMYRFIHYIRDAIQQLKPDNIYIAQQNQPKLLLWTGSKTALVELIYALHAVGDINHGAVELQTITSAFESFFNTKLNTYKTYAELKARKGDLTQYLHKLIVHLEHRMRRDDEL
ncbi:RteC domain-containing protein [Salegentibacter echinorum]|nr:RteC domain-containing protein [Salegentibacter echinorum]